MEEPIEERGDGGGIPEQFPPVVDRPVRGEQRARPLVAAHDELEEILGRGGRELPHAEVVDDEERHGGELGHLLAPGAVEGGVREFVEEPMGLGVPDAVALLDRRVADRLGKVTLAGAGRPEEERVVVRGDEAAGGELEDAGAIHLLVEVEVEGVEGLAGVAEAGVGPAALEEAVLTADEFVGDERGDEIERRQPLGLGLAEAGFERRGHAGEAELADGAVEFGERHSGTSGSGWRSMRSR